MRWPWRRRWGYVVTFANPRTGDVIDRHEMPVRCWTEGGARRAADMHLQDATCLPELASWVSVEVRGGLPPVVDVYADRYWMGDTYVGPEV